MNKRDWEIFDSIRDHAKNKWELTEEQVLFLIKYVEMAEEIFSKSNNVLLNVSHQLEEINAKMLSAAPASIFENGGVEDV